MPEKMPLVSEYEYGGGPLLNNREEKNIVTVLTDAGAEGLSTKALLHEVQAMGGNYTAEETGHELPLEHISDVDDVQEAYMRLESHGIIERDKKTDVWR